MRQKVRCRAAIVFTLSIVAAMGFGEPRPSVSGNISLSVSPKSGRTFLSLALPFDVIINASAPLTLDKDTLNSSSVTVKGKLGGLTVAAGNLRISDAAGFLARPDLVSSRGGSLLSCTNLGNSDDPLGIGVVTSRLSLFLTRNKLYTCGALQGLLLEKAARMTVGLGALWGEEDQGPVVRRMRPWFAFGVGYLAPNVSFLTRLQIYPDFEAFGRDFFGFAWLKAAAGRIDLSWNFCGQRIQGILYAESGDFISATGKVASRDAMAQVDYDADVSWVPLAQNLSFGACVFSRQGAAEMAVGATPSFGRFPNFFVLKYWPDGAEGHFHIKNKELKGGLFHAAIVLDSSFSCEVIKKPGTWSGKFGFDLSVRSTGVAAPRSAAAQPAVARPSVPSLGLEFALQTSCWEQEDASQTDESFGDISEYEESENASATVEPPTGALTLDRADVALRAALGLFSCRTAIDIPLKQSDSNTLRVKIRASAKMAYIFVEASGTGEVEVAEKRFSMETVHLYVKIPL